MVARHHQCRKNGHPDNGNLNGKIAKVETIRDKKHYSCPICGNCKDKVPEGDRICPTCGCRLENN